MIWMISLMWHFMCKLILMPIAFTENFHFCHLLQRRNSFNQGRRKVSGRSLKAQREDSIRRTVYVSEIDQHVSELRMAWIKFYLDLVCLAFHIRHINEFYVGCWGSNTTLLLYLCLGLTVIWSLTKLNGIMWIVIHIADLTLCDLVFCCCCSLFSVLFQS